ncbi:hypothetical protein Dimus_029108, partial [Dionaea muscipula]
SALLSPKSTGSLGFRQGEKWPVESSPRSFKITAHAPDTGVLRSQGRDACALTALPDFNCRLLISIAAAAAFWACNWWAAGFFILLLASWTAAAWAASSATNYCRCISRLYRWTFRCLHLLIGELYLGCFMGRVWLLKCCFLLHGYMDVGLNITATASHFLL